MLCIWKLWLPSRHEPCHSTHWKQYVIVKRLMFNIIISSSLPSWSWQSLNISLIFQQISLEKRNEENYPFFLLLMVTTRKESNARKMCTQFLLKKKKCLIIQFIIEFTILTWMALSGRIITTLRLNCWLNIRRKTNSNYVYLYWYGHSMDTIW